MKYLVAAQEMRSEPVLQELLEASVAPEVQLAALAA